MGSEMCIRDRCQPVDVTGEWLEDQFAEVERKDRQEDKAGESLGGRVSPDSIKGRA